MAWWPSEGGMCEARSDGCVQCGVGEFWNGEESVCGVCSTSDGACVRLYGREWWMSGFGSCTGAEESDTCVVCRAWEVLVVSEAECVPELSQFSLGLVGATTDCGVVSSIVVEGTSVSVGASGGEEEETTIWCVGVACFVVRAGGSLVLGGGVRLNGDARGGVGESEWLASGWAVRVEGDGVMSATGTVFSVGLGAGLVCAGEWFDAEVGVVHLHAVECAGESVCDLNSVDAGNVTVRLLNGAVESGLRCGVHVELVVGVAGDGPSLVVGDTVVVDVFVRESGEGVHVAALCSAVVSASVTCAATVGACSVGEYLSGVCGGAPTPSCVACTNKPGNSTYTSRGGTSSDCGWVCNVEHYQSGITCPACSVTCPGGQYISAACGVSRDIVCTACGSEEYESEGVCYACTDGMLGKPGHSHSM